MNANVSWDRRAAVWLVRFRLPLTLLVLLGVGGILAGGVGRVVDVTGAVSTLGDTTSGAGAPPPIVFDPRMSVWFGAEDEAVDVYREIEDRFVAEDYVVVSFQASEGDPFGVFGREHLDRIARLTEGFLKVPGVRHVRSLTYNPWIRWGTIEDEQGSEEGLLITDLVEGDPYQLEDDEIVERMVAVLGAERTAARLGEERVRSVIGDVDFADLIGEPLLLGTIVDETGTTTALQVQVLRPRPAAGLLDAAFGDDDETKDAGRTLWSIQMQRSALRGIRHVLGLELGTTIPTDELAGLESWVASLPEGEEREALEVELRDPSRNFMQDERGEVVRKYLEYQPAGSLADGEVKWVDRSNPAAVIDAPAGWQPPEAPVEFHIGGIPVFELNFEEVGMADSKYVPLMFLVILVCLIVVFRHPVGVVAPLAVVFGAVLGMLGFAFGKGDLMNNLTMMSPNMLTAVGIADAIHLVAAWAMLRTRIDDKRELLVEVVRVNALPVLLTSITTAIGFYSLTASELTPVRMLGYTAGLGTLFAYLLSMTLVPFLLGLFPHSGRAPERRAWLSGVFTQARSKAWIQGLVRRRRGILGASALVLVVALVGVGRIRINSDFREMFPPANRVMSDFNWIEGQLGGLGDLELVFRGVAAPEVVELTTQEEARLTELRLARSVRAAGHDDFGPEGDGEAGELAALERKAAAWNAARIGVDPSFLDSLDRFERRMREEMADPDSALAVLSDFTSPLDILRKMNQVQHENRAAAYRVPRPTDVPEDLRQPTLAYDDLFEEWSLSPGQDASSLVAQYYLQYENGARPGENLSTQLSHDRQQFRMQGRIRQAPTQSHLDAFARIEELARQEFPELDVQASTVEEPADERMAPVVAAVDRTMASGDSAGRSDMVLSGKSLLNARTMRLFSVGFVKSMSIALVMITLIIGILFRSVTLAIVSLLPNVLPIVVPLSFFGLFGFELDGPAILVSSVALGVCVDDTIHFFTKFVRSRRSGSSLEDALVYALSQSGGALTITTVVLIVGFSTLLLSEFTPNFMMGTLASLMIGLAWAADFVVTPALLSLLPHVGRTASTPRASTERSDPTPVHA